ncbi:MAG: hypothetical protein K9J37_07930 [Saprospiraceae bacterium]|nr:hypothetical protein [Saprospiraceae bacterium]MCF8249827.1 hypothetical protein [Saprospiraceae bacterium]MCF8279503.1 hypothetical protein [Bacteroidales bacterium]MCF8311739.1 hypothetical protein [Saprospiraceae bacterium]MCF8440306.1 hypothetical protein [Saprospiraceae bacterium]
MKKIIAYILVGTFLLTHHSEAFGQDKSIGILFVANGSSANTNLLKWVLPAFGAKEGFKVYRQSNGESTWVLLNPNPVKKMPKLELSPMDKGDDMVYLEDYIQNNDLSKADAFTLLLLSRKMVELNEFAKYLGLFYQDDTAESGKTYRYKVTKLEKGKEQLVGISEAVETKAFQPILPPQGIKIMVNEKIDTMVEVFWTPEETRYFAVNVYRALEGQTLEKINDIPAIPSQTNVSGKLVYPNFFYNRGDHKVGKTYTYQLKAIDFFGRESTISPSYKVEIIDRTPPQPPTGLETVRAGPHEVLVSWAASESGNLAGYDVFVGDSVTAVFVKANETRIPASQTKFTHKITDEKWGDKFFYVEAINAAGTRTASTKMGLTVNDVIPPAAPTGVLASPFEGAIEISWDIQLEPDLMGYVVYRSVANTPGAPFTLISSGAIDTTSFLDSLPREARNKYFYKVAAMDNFSNLSERSETVSAVMPDVIAPISPTIISVEIKSDTAMLTWLPSIDDELKGYHLYRSSDLDTTQWLPLGGELLSPLATHFTDAGLQAGMTYYYQLTAEDHTGNISVTSNRYSVSTSPSHGEDLVAGKLKATYAKRKKTATLSWKQDSPTLVEGSMVYRKVGNGRFLPLSDLLTKETEYTDANLEPEESYKYQLRTYYKDGNMTLSEAVEVVAK